MAGLYARNVLKVQSDITARSMVLGNIAELHSKLKNLVKSSVRNAKV